MHRALSLRRILRRLRTLRCAPATWAALCLATFAGDALLAQQHPNLERGFSPEKLYQTGDVDSVNVLNGNVTVTIPIGMEYPAGGSLRYALTLTYNSKVWDIEERASFTPDGPYVQALPNRRSNAGMGWQLSLGRLVPPGDPTNHAGSSAWVYVSPDGSEHVLYGSPGHFRDGSFLRLRHLAGSVRELDFPDGTIHRFDASNRLVEIRDRFSSPNKITVAYVGDTWEIRDRFGRKHIVTFAQETQDLATVFFVEKVVTVGFGGAQQEYRFTYVDRTFPRPNGGLQGFCYDTDPITASTVTAPLLEALQLPDGSSYQFSYHLSEPGTACRTGAIASLRLPTFGRLEWDYAGRALPTEGCEPTQHWGSKSPGVAKRRQLDAAGVLLGEWSYSFALSPSPDPGPGDPSCQEVGESLPREEARVVVTSPLKDQTTHYFSVWPNPWTSINGFHRSDYGLPFTRRQPGDGAGRFLSREIADCNASGGSCVKKRSEYVRYENDGLCSLADPFPWCVDVNRRLAAQRTTFDDDGGASISNDLTEYDGFGHYRMRTTTGTFPAVVGGTVSETNRQTYTNWTPTATAGVWVLDTASFEWVKENGVFARYAQNCYLANTNFLTRRRVHVAAGSATSPSDLLVVFDPDTAGNVVSERYYGGDAPSQALALGSPCTIGLPAAPQYRIDHTYQSGVLATSKYNGATFSHVDRTIDVSGLVRSVRDSAGIQTDFEYDAAGRRTWEKPATGHDGWVEYKYEKATAASPANVLVRRRGNGPSGSSTVLANESYTFDALGRLQHEQRLLPSGQWSTRTTLYDGAGNVASVSELQAGGAPKVTAYQSYDPFGRPRLIVPPDGVGHKTDLAYLGARRVQRKVRVGTAYNAISDVVTESTATTTELYDIHGRLAQVTEPNGVHTTYRYDGADRLRRVCQGASGSTCGQERLFNYDNRGFLTSERHPEKGAFGNGFVTYSAFDARGHAGRRVDGPFNLTFTHDFAERLTQVREGNGQQRVLKQFTYATANGTGDFARGKRKTASRFNYVLMGTTPFTVELEETYTYGGRHGRVSRRDTATFVNSGPFESFTQAWSYTPLGDVDVLTYPRCTHAACGGPSTVSRTVGHTYDRGFLTAVPGYATSISYHPNQTVSQVIHANGVQWNQAMDPNHMARPASISTAGATTNWSSGAYAYDGAGNVTRTGGAYFLYDALSRLKTARLYASITGGGLETLQSYTYDNYGNLIAMVGGGGTSIPVSSATNRLTGSVAYDAAGNLTAWNGNSYEVDAFGMIWRYRPANQPGVEHIHLYTADDERLWTFSPGQPSRWTLRDLDGKVLREFSNNAGTWSVFRDYVYRGSTLVSAVQPDGQVFHLHPDHLGTPRLVTKGGGLTHDYDVYLPYGMELSPLDPDGERLKFTGHERDLGVVASVADDLDYMHARFYNPQVGRLLRVDPVLGGLPAPQRWNRYAYVTNNPVSFIDPTGMILVGSSQLVETLQNALSDTGSGELARTIRLERVETRRSMLFGLITWTTTETRVVGDVQALARSANPIANLTAQAIRTDTRIEVSFDSTDLALTGGARTRARHFNQRNLISIIINSDQVAAARIPSDQGSVPIPLAAALVHELGHAWGHFTVRIPWSPRFGGPSPTDNQAVYWENVYRDAANLPRRSWH